MKINEIKDDVADNHRAIAANHGMLMSSYMKTFMAFAETVKTDCQPYLKEVDYSPIRKYALYRGVIHTKKTYIAKTVRLQNRKPKDTEQKLHDKINKYFKKNYGVPFRNGIFATSSLDQTEEYAHGGLHEGEVYIIFPVGEFKYLWSPHISDMLDAIYEHDVISNAAPGHKSGWKAFKNEALSTYQTTNLTRGIKSGNEIMIYCKEYYGIKYEDILNQKFWGAFEELLRS